MIFYFKNLNKSTFLAFLGKIICFYAIFCCLATISNAKNPKYLQKVELIDKDFKKTHIAKFKDWSVHKIKTSNYKSCYSLSLPFATKGNKVKRAQPFFTVMNVDNDADEITFSSGFYFKENIDIELAIGNKKFFLFPFKNYGWTYSKNDDIDIIKEMQKNDEFLITYYNKSNKIVIDKYSLIGFRESYFKLKEICKL